MAVFHLTFKTISGVEFSPKTLPLPLINWALRAKLKEQREDTGYSHQVHITVLLFQQNNTLTSFFSYGKHIFCTVVKFFKEMCILKIKWKDTISTPC